MVYSYPDAVAVVIQSWRKTCSLWGSPDPRDYDGIKKKKKKIIFLK